MRANRSGAHTDGVRGWGCLGVLASAVVAHGDAADLRRPGPATGPITPAPAATDTSVPAIGSAWPVGDRPAVLRGWEPPATAYGRGHRGVDLAAVPGTPVRAVAAGRVSFAGRVAGRGVVSVELTGTGDPPLGRRTSRSGRRCTRARRWPPGAVLGTVEPTGSHCTVPCVHWGLLRAETYLDPLSLLPPWLLSRGPSRLLPVIGVAVPS